MTRRDLAGTADARRCVACSGMAPKSHKPASKHLQSQVTVRYGRLTDEVPAGGYRMAADYGYTKYFLGGIIPSGHPSNLVL